jgi:hypothetical protein
MVVTLMEIENGKFKLEDKIEVNHNFMLESYDYTSRLPTKSEVGVLGLMSHMIQSSDNEATNLLLDKIGVMRFNEIMWGLGMKNSAVGHLLCPKVTRYETLVNPSGDNLTTTEDMNICLRHMYDSNFSKLSPFVRGISDSVMSLSSKGGLGLGKFRKFDVKTKDGYISCPTDGEDVHEVGVVSKSLLISVMVNKYKNSFVLLPTNIFEEKEPSKYYKNHGIRLRDECLLSLKGFIGFHFRGFNYLDKIDEQRRYMISENLNNDKFNKLGINQNTNQLISSIYTPDLYRKPLISPTSIHTDIYRVIENNFK